MPVAGHAIISNLTFLPEYIAGVTWSGQWSFWQNGYPGVMVTDIAPFRYPYYHTHEDIPEKIDYDRLAYLVSILEKVEVRLAASDK